MSEELENNEQQIETTEDFVDPAFDGGRPDYFDGGEGEIPEDENTPAEPETTEGGEETSEQPQIFATVNSGGRDYQFETREQLEAMARRGIELSPYEGKMQAYSQAIQQIESNPALSNAVGQMLQHYNKTGTVIPLNVPQAQQAAADPNAEPEIQDDETYEEYEKRLGKWKEDQMMRRVEQRVAQTLQARDQYAAQQRVAAANETIVNLIKYGDAQRGIAPDPDRLEVIARIRDPRYCSPAIAQMANDNGEVFMRVYDDIKRGMGKPPFYGAPSLVAQYQQPAVTQQAPVQPQRSAPFSESAKTSSAQAVPGQGKRLPFDFKAMSDEEFKTFKDRLKFQNY